MKRCLALTLFCAITAGYAPAIDREAFSITRYQLEVQVDRHSHVMAVTGKLTLRNDSDKAQKIVALQVSSSLAWNSITLDGKPLQWLSDIYTSDVDHTGEIIGGDHHLAQGVAAGWFASPSTHNTVERSCPTPRG